MQGEFPVTKIVTELSRDNLLPAILFRTSRKQCDQDIERLADITRLHLDANRQEILKQEVSKAVAKYGLDLSVIELHLHYSTLLKTGIGAHHAGQLLAWRLLLEELMTRGVLQLMVATGTVAAGVDFPARTVIVTAHSKRGTEGFNNLTSSEFQQMSGRAGRRGKDTVGICLIAPGPYCDARVLYDIARRPPEPLRSAYFAAPATVLNLLKHRNVDELFYTVNRSLAAFTDKRAAQKLRLEATQTAEEAPAGETSEREKKRIKRARRLEREADELEFKQNNLLKTSLSGLEGLGYVQNGILSAKGLWAAELCTSIVLELSEAIGDFLFSEITTQELVGLVASIAGDPHRMYFSLMKNPIPKEKFSALAKIVARVADNYKGSPFANEVKVQPDAAITVMTWMDAQSWEEFSSLLRLQGVAEGDASRLITQTADHLHQISRLHESHPDLARQAGEARLVLLRPPITDAYEGLLG